MLKINNTITVELLVEEINYGQLQIPSNAAIISYKMRVSPNLLILKLMIK